MSHLARALSATVIALVSSQREGVSQEPTRPLVEVAVETWLASDLDDRSILDRAVDAILDGGDDALRYLEKQLIRPEIDTRQEQDSNL
jgi:hypothetical protein